MRLALFQPDIPQNAGTLIRLAACLGIAVDIIEPCGFLLGDRHLHRAGLDYLDVAVVARHASWAAFFDQIGEARLVLLTTRSDTGYCDVRYASHDVLLVGRETGGVTEEVDAAADLRVRVPMLPGRRSLNVAVAAAMVLGEALRQTAGFAQPGVAP
jgi:tRNA (cytidine/uridine-2'-O-)-methyltransferase